MVSQSKAPLIRIFPHSKKEFKDTDELRQFLYVTVRLRNGMYRLKKKLVTPVGSIILFRFENKIHGEAIVRRTIESTGDTQWPYAINLDPGSIRIYKHPVPIKMFETILMSLGINQKITGVAQTYYKIKDWTAYSLLLKEVAVSGFV